MKNLQEVFWKNTLILTTVLLANHIAVSGQVPDVFTDPASADVNSAVFIRPDSFGDIALILGTNKGKAMFTRMKMAEVLSKPAYKIFAFSPSRASGAIRSINFVSNNEGYLLRTDGLFFSDGNTPFWKEKVNPLDLQEQDATAEFWGISFLGDTKRACLIGRYTIQSGNTIKTDKELLRCTDNISESRPIWKEARLPENRKTSVNFLTNIYFDKNGNGWAVGVDGVNFKEGVIWYSADSGRSWEELNINTQSFLINVGKSENRLFAVGFNGVVFASDISDESLAKNDKVEIQRRILTRIQNLPGVRTITKIIGKVKEVNDKGMLEIDVEEIFPKDIPKNEKRLIEDYFRTTPIAPKDVKKLNSAGKERPSNNWQPFTVPTKENLRDIKFDDDGKYGFIVGDNGTILFTEDAGNNWRIINSPKLKTPKIDLYSIYVGDQYCWIGGSKGTIVRIKYK